MDQPWSLGGGLRVVIVRFHLFAALWQCGHPFTDQRPLRLQMNIQHIENRTEIAPCDSGLAHLDPLNDFAIDVGHLSQVSLRESSLSSVKTDEAIESYHKKKGTISPFERAKGRMEKQNAPS